MGEVKYVCSFLWGEVAVQVRFPFVKTGVLVVFRRCDDNVIGQRQRVR